MKLVMWCAIFLCYLAFNQGFVQGGSGFIEGAEYRFEESAQSSILYRPSIPARNISWVDAYWACKHQGDELLAVDSANEANWIYQRLADGSRTELRWFINAHKFLYGNEPSWSNKIPLSRFSRFSVETFSSGIECSGVSTKAKFNLHNECFSLLHDGKIVDVNCTSKEQDVGYICKRRRNLENNLHGNEVKPIRQSCSSSICPSRWLPSSDPLIHYCYFAVQKESNWYQARFFCEKLQSELISIGDIEDLKKIRYVLIEKYERNVHSVWLNIHKYLFEKGKWA